MPDHVSVECLEAMSTLFFQRLAETNTDLIGILSDVAVQIEDRNHNALLALYADLERRVQSIRTILIVFRDALEG